MLDVQICGATNGRKGWRLCENALICYLHRADRGSLMTRFIEGCDRRQRLLLPDCVDDYVGEDSSVRVVDVFIDELDLEALGLAGAAATGRPGYHPATLLKLYLYGYLNQVQSSRRLEREARSQRVLAMSNSAYFAL
jgi:hypothetical protein